MTPRVLILVFDQFQLLDASGPASAFELAGTLGGQPYALRVVAERKGLIASSAGIAISAHKMTPVSARDTLIVAGGAGVDAAARDLALLDYIRTSADGGSRVVSICTGAFLLAAAGLLNMVAVRRPIGAVDGNSVSGFRRSMQIRTASTCNPAVSGPRPG